MTALKTVIDFNFDQNPEFDFWSGSNRIPVPLGDPTCYAPVIDYVRSMAETMKDGSNYIVLLIITDGGIKGKILEFQ